MFEKRGEMYTRGNVNMQQTLLLNYPDVVYNYRKPLVAKVRREESLATAK